MWVNMSYVNPVGQSIRCTSYQVGRTKFLELFSHPKSLEKQLPTAPPQKKHPDSAFSLASAFCTSFGWRGLARLQKGESIPQNITMSSRVNALILLVVLVLCASINVLPITLQLS